MTILDYAHYPAIRAAIDVSLDSASLPDDVIELPIYVHAADLELKTRDPLWATRTGDSLLQLQIAAVYLTAARLAGAIPQIAGEDFAEYSYKLQAIDWGARAAELRALASAALDAVLDVGDVVSDRPSFFGVASSRRGRW